MALLDDILQFNQQFVREKKYVEYKTTKFPNKKLVILTCMDTRLTELLPKALDVGNGDVKLIKNAGALVAHPFGSIMRSLLVAIYELKANEVLVIGHHDCGMAGMKADSLIKTMKDRGVREETLEMLKYSGIEIDKWLKGFENVEESVTHSVNMIQKHPLFPKDVPVHGLVIHPETGKLEVVRRGYGEE